MKSSERMLSEHAAAEPRRRKMHLGPFSANYYERKRPWVAAWWSAAFPGFGHIHLGLWLKGVILMSCEIVFNLYGNINLAIVYSLTGQFDRLHDGLINYNFLFLYAALYVFGIWDAFRLSVEMNKISYLESRQTVRDFQISHINSININYLDKRIPWLAAFWSMIFTGIGHLYNHKMLSGLLLMIWSFIISINSNLPYLVIFTLTGQFERIREVAQYNWLLFFPSTYFFGIYDAYSSAVGHNRLFREEQIYYLKTRFKKTAVHK